MLLAIETTGREQSPKLVARHPTARASTIRFQGGVYRYSDFLSFRSAGLTDEWARFAAVLAYNPKGEPRRG